MEAWREELHEDLYHSFKGQEWKHHKYIRKEGNRYIYPEDVKSFSKPQKGWISDTASSVGSVAATVGAAVSNAASSVGSVAATVGAAVSNAATSVANAVGDTWNTIASSVGTAATDLYNNISAAVTSAITQHKDDVSWPKQKDQSDAHNRVGIAEKTSIPWNEKLNNYIKTRLAIIGDDKERLSDLYTAVSYLTYNHLNTNGLLAKPATVSTPLHEGLDLASLAKAIDVDASDLTEEDVATLTYALWGVLDAKMRGVKNPLVEGKGEIRYNLMDQIQGKPQQKRELLNKINSNKDRFSPQNTASKTKNDRSVVVKPNNKKLIHSDDDLYHHGIKGQKWYVRRYQNEDGTLTEAGKKRYNKMNREYEKASGIYKEGLRIAQEDRAQTEERQRELYDLGKISEKKMQRRINKKVDQEKHFAAALDITKKAWDVSVKDFNGELKDSDVKAAKSLVGLYKSVKFDDARPFMAGAVGPMVIVTLPNQYHSNYVRGRREYRRSQKG